jgi:iron complex transport system substrate-binding protein
MPVRRPKAQRPEEVSMLKALTRLIALSAMVLVPYGDTVARAQSDTSDFPMTITDDSGATVTFNAPPQRVVSLNPGLTEITFALGHGSSVIAVDSYSDYPPEAKDIQPRLNTYPDPSIETIVSMGPDLVLSLADPDQDVAQLRQQGVPVLKFFPKTFDATVETIRTLGRLYGSPDAGEAVAADMLSRRDAVLAEVTDAPRPRVYEELDATDPDKPFVAGPNGFYGQLIDLAGGTNIFGDLPGDVAQVGAENVIQRDPEVIILTDADLPFNPQTPALVAARPGWNTVTAVKNGAIYAVPAELYSSIGPRLVQGLEELAHILHPDLVPAGARVPVLLVN